MKAVRKRKEWIKQVKWKANRSLERKCKSPGLWWLGERETQPVEFNPMLVVLSTHVIQEKPGLFP
jgi:hypothetical protein